MRRFYVFLLMAFAFQAGLKSQDCSINDLVVTTSACDELYMFTATIDFNAQNTTSAFFTVVGNGNNYGSFAYADLPVTIGPLFGDNETPYEFLVYDNDNLDCQAAYELGVIDCGPFCGFEDVALDLVTCQSNITAIFVLDFEFLNVEGNAFDLYYENGEPIGSWLYESLPVTLSNFLVNGNDPIVIEICDDDNELCCQTFELPPIDCNPDNCEIYNLSAEPTCDGGTFTVEVNFNVDNPASDSFKIMGNGINYGDFSYSDLPVTLGPLNGSSNIPWEFGIQDLGNENCSNAIELGMIQCPMACMIENLVADAVECTSDSTYAVMLNAAATNASEQGFTLYTSGQVIGQYSYDDLPLTIPDFPASGDFFDVITICDNGEGECCATVEFASLQCGGCLIYDLQANLLPCNDEDGFFVELDFLFQNPGSLGFQVGGNGNIYGQYDYEDLPLTIGPLPADGTTFYEFVVLDIQNGGCLDAVETGIVECEDICGFTGITVTELACSGDNRYSLVVDFNHSGTGDGFSLFAGNTLWGTFSYDVLPLAIDNFPASGDTVDVIEICDLQDPDCCAVIEFEAIDCDLPCEISDVTVTPGTCTSDSTFSAVIGFDFANIESNVFSLFSGDLLLGTFEKGPEDITVENFPSSPEGTNNLTVCSEQDTLCCTTLEFGGLDCFPPECSIFDLEVTEVICASDSTVDVFLNFLYEDTGSNFFDIFDGDDTIGFFEKTDDPLLLEGLPLGDTNEKAITICANDMPDCCETIFFETPVCLPDTCILEIVSIFAVECLSDSTFRANVSIQYDGLSNTFEVFHMEAFLGTFEANENGQFSIPNFPSTDGGINQIIVCSTSQSMCCDTAEFEGLICDPDLCLIDDIAVDASACTSDSTFTAFVQFLYQNTQSDTFDIFTAEGYLGTYGKGEAPLELTGFPANTNGNYVVTICARDVEGCCATAEFTGPVCSAECTIFNLAAEPVECESPETFIVDVEFDYVNLEGNGVDIYAGDTYLGFYEIAAFPIQVFGFPVPAGELAEITVCQSDDTVCCTSVQFEPLDCGETFCDIFDLTYELSECDSADNFFVTLDFGFINTNEAGFNVVGNGINYGNYPYDSIPLTIGPLPADPLIAYEFLVQDVVDNICFDFVDVGVVNCETTSTGRGPLMLDIKLMYQNHRPYLLVPEAGLELRLFSANGKLVYTEQGMEPGTWHQIRSASLPEGIYFIHMFNERQVYTGKVLVTK